MRSYWNIDAGLSVKVVFDLLGHTNAAQTLNKYAHLWPTDDGLRIPQP